MHSVKGGRAADLEHKLLHLLFGILALFLLFAVEAHAQSKWPADVQRFIQRRDACDHFRGEDPYDEERRKFLQQKMAEFCIGTDHELSRLKTRYRNDKKITAKLNEYE